MPDHGKIMHLFLIGASEPRAFAHLHPVQKETTVFDATLPPLPAGSYHLYADITHENGFAETLVSSVKIPQASPAMKRLWLGNSSEPICSVKVAQTLAANLSFPPDPDDSWYVGNDRSATSVSVNGSEEIAQLSGGYQIVRENSGPIRARRDTSLRFRLIAPTNEPASIEPYMGMAGHAVVWRLDGGVFAHIHPVGTFSMAAQEFFVNGKPKDSGSNGRGDALATLHTNHVEAVSSNTEITFPCEFPSVGTYRIWVQMKSHGRILTGEFPATIGGG